MAAAAAAAAWRIVSLRRPVLSCGGAVVRQTPVACSRRSLTAGAWLVQRSYQRRVLTSTAQRLGKHARRPCRCVPLRSHVSFATSASIDDKTAATASGPLLDEAPVLCVRTTCPGDLADSLADALLSFGATSCTLEDANAQTDEEEPIFHTSGEVPYEDKWGTKMPRWTKTTLLAHFPNDTDIHSALLSARAAVGLNEADSDVPAFEIRELEQKDWAQAVRDSFRPLEVVSGLWIVPEWSTPVEPDAVNVILEPGLAFGTGEHPTTRLCIQWLRSVVKPGDVVMDYGIGSGILALAALKLGAVSAYGVDIDKLALSSSERNASLNGEDIARSLRLYLTQDDGSDPVPDAKGTCDVVVANILLGPVTALVGRLVRYARPGGHVGLSGILATQVPRVLDAYSPYLTDIRVEELEQWACVYGVTRTSA